MFKLEPIDNNIFMVIKRDSLVNGEIYKKLPIEVYGFIRVNIFKNRILNISTMNISEELTVSSELPSLEEEAKKIVRNHLNNN